MIMSRSRACFIAFTMLNCPTAALTQSSARRCIRGISILTTGLFIFCNLLLPCSRALAADAIEEISQSQATTSLSDAPIVEEQAPGAADYEQSLSDSDPLGEPTYDDAGDKVEVLVDADKTDEPNPDDNALVEEDSLAGENEEEDDAIVVPPGMGPLVTETQGNIDQIREWLEILPEENREPHMTTLDGHNQVFRSIVDNLAETQEGIDAQFKQLTDTAKSIGALRDQVWDQLKIFLDAQIALLRNAIQESIADAEVWLAMLPQFLPTEEQELIQSHIEILNRQLATPAPDLIQKFNDLHDLWGTAKDLRLRAKAEALRFFREQIDLTMAGIDAANARVQPWLNVLGQKAEPFIADLQAQLDRLPGIFADVHLERQLADIRNVFELFSGIVDAARNEALKLLDGQILLARQEVERSRQAFAIIHPDDMAPHQGRLDEIDRSLQGTLQGLADEALVQKLNQIKSELDTLMAQLRPTIQLRHDIAERETSIQETASRILEIARNNFNDPERWNFYNNALANLDQRFRQASQIPDAAARLAEDNEILRLAQDLLQAAEAELQQMRQP